MTPTELTRLLAAAAALDPRVGRRDPDQTRLMVSGWFSILDPDIPYEWGIEAIKHHYRYSTEMLMPAHIMQEWSARRRREQQQQRDSRALLEAKNAEQDAVPMPLEIRQQLGNLQAKWDVNVGE